MTRYWNFIGALKGGRDLYCRARFQAADSDPSTSDGQMPDVHTHIQGGKTMTL